MVTIKDIAERASVSVTTVSRVLNNRPDVSDKTRKKVKTIIEKLGYNPNSIARGLVLRRSFTIGLAIPGISNPFFPEVAKGVQSKAKDKGYSVILYDTNNDIEEEKEAIRILRCKQVDGMILSLSMENRDELLALEERGFPVVQIDRIIPECTSLSVTIDNVMSAREATQHLVELGHKYIAHISGSFYYKTARDRLCGFQQCIYENNLPYDDVYILEGNYTKESGYKQMKALLDKSPRPTAVFVANDLMALGCYEAIFDAGLSVPEHISVVGHDDIELSSIVRPGLTTVMQPKYELGQVAADVLIRKIEEKKDDENTEHIGSVILDTKLVIRGSTRRV